MPGSPIQQLVIAASTLILIGAVACGGDGSPTSPAPPSTTGAAEGGSGGSGAAGGSGASGGTSGSGSGSSSNATTASLAINLTDSPFSDAKALLVTFSGVSVHSADGDAWQTIPFVSGSSRTCDLKKLNGPTDVLGVGSLPTGKYTQVRLMVSSAALYFDAASAGSACASSIAPPSGANAPVEIPSGEVKLNHEFTVTGTGSTMLLDFDGDQSVRQTGSGNSNGNGNGRGGAGTSNSKYMMTPVIRVVSVQ